MPTFLLEIHYNKGNFEQAIESYYKVLAIKPDNVEAFNSIGTALKTKKFSESINTSTIKQ